MTPQPIQDLVTFLAEDVVDPILAGVEEAKRDVAEVPSIVVRNRRLRARYRLAEALASATPPTTGTVSDELRRDVERLVRRWAATGFEDGFPEVEDFEIRCGEEYERLEAEQSGDPEEILAVAERMHRRRVKEEHGTIEIRGLQMSERVYQPLSVAYVPLFLEDPTWTEPVEKIDGIEIRHIPRLAVSDVLDRHSRVLVVGAPGSGKSTLVSYLATCAATGRWQDGTDWEELIVPFVVPVRSLTEPRIDFEALVKSAAGDEDLVRHALDRGRALILVDGLDEASPERIVRIRASLDELARTCGENRIVVTSRPAAVEEKDDSLTSFAHAQLLPMTREEIDVFVDRWCLAAEISIRKDQRAAEEAARVAAEDLKARLRASRPVEKLVETPLLATILCVVHRFLGQRIPERRVALYEACTNVLLYEWDRSKFPDGAVVGSLDAAEKRSLLGALAAAMHEFGVAEFGEEEVVQEFSERLPLLNRSATEARTAVAEIRDRSGILVECRSGVFSFSHLAFQEYLTAVECVGRGGYEKLVERHRDPWWHEVVALAAGLPRADADRLIEGLLGFSEDEDDFSTFLAASCLNTAIEVSTPLRNETTRRIAKLIPPSDREGKSRLEKIGEIAAPPLLRSLIARNGSADEQAWTILTLAALMYEPACGEIAKLTADTSPIQVREVECPHLSIHLLGPAETLADIASFALWDMGTLSRVALVSLAEAQTSVGILDDSFFWAVVRHSANGHREHPDTKVSCQLLSLVKRAVGRRNLQP